VKTLPVVNKGGPRDGVHWYRESVTWGGQDYNLAPESVTELPEDVARGIQWKHAHEGIQILPEFAGKENE